MINFTGSKTAITRFTFLFKSSRTQYSNKETSMRLVLLAMPMVSAKFLMASGVYPLRLIPEMVLILGSSQPIRSEEHTSELQSRPHLVCRLLLEKKKLNDDHINR